MSINNYQVKVLRTHNEFTSADVTTPCWRTCNTQW